MYVRVCYKVGVGTVPVLTFFCHFWVITVRDVFLDGDNRIAAGCRTCGDVILWFSICSENENQLSGGLCNVFGPLNGYQIKISRQL